jgi:hypothetical protein
MAMMVQFPSPALWHQLLSGPPVSREQDTGNPAAGLRDGFNEMIYTQLANQNAIAGLQPPPPRAPALQRPGPKDPRERGRNPRDPQPEQEQNPRHPFGDKDGERRPLIRAVWA